jgi:hypothetical protein
MTPLDTAIAHDISRAYAAIGRIAQLRAEARAIDIAALSGGSITASPEQVSAIATHLQKEMIGDLTRDVRASLSFFVTTNEPLKG